MYCLHPLPLMRILLTLVSFFVYQFVCVDAQLNYVDRYCTGTDFNYTHGSLYEQNLNGLFENLSSQSSNAKFYNFTVGNGSNKVYGLFQCRNDLSLQVCSGCVQDAAKQAIKLCPLFGEAIVWYYECMLRYADHNIFSKEDSFPGIDRVSPLNVSNNAEFAPVLAGAMNGVIKTAIAASPHFAASEANVSSAVQLYSFAQCTPDIGEFDCNACLRSALSDMSTCCTTSLGAMVFLPSCQLRYDTSPFIIALPQTSSPTGPRKVKLKPAIIIAIHVAAIGGFLLLLFTVGLWLHMRRSHYEKNSRETPLEAPKLSQVVISHEDSLGDAECEQYDFNDLKLASGDFSSENMLGEGGFGVVYKGTLPNGQQIAIKRLSGTSGQGTKEFMTEAKIVAKLQHKNLVKFVGFCSQADEKLLVYEYMPNTSIDHFLFDPRMRPLLDWQTRYRMIMGTARGLQYLHEDSRLTIIHRDLKPSNILLDSHMNPKIADFGMAKLFKTEQKLGNTNRIVGTHGYVAPKYIVSGEYSDKSDVYSFGIIVLEMISGHKNRILYQSPQREDLPILAWRLWNEGRSFELADTALYNNCSMSEVIRCIQIGQLCVQSNPQQRPPMSAVVHMLTGSGELPLPCGPAMSPESLTGSLACTGEHQSIEPDQSSTTSITWHPNMEQDLYPRPR